MILVRVVVDFCRIDPPEGRVTAIATGEGPTFYGWLGLIGVLAEVCAEAMGRSRPIESTPG